MDFVDRDTVRPPCLQLSHSLHARVASGEATAVGMTSPEHDRLRAINANQLDLRALGCTVVCPERLAAWDFVELGKGDTLER